MAKIFNCFDFRYKYHTHPWINHSVQRWYSMNRWIENIFRYFDSMLCLWLWRFFWIRKYECRRVLKDNWHETLEAIVQNNGNPQSISTKKLNIEFLGPTRDRQTERFGRTGDVHRFLRWTTVGIDALEYSDRVDGIIWFWTNWKGLSRCWRCLQDYCDSWNLFFRGFLWQYS